MTERGDLHVRGGVANGTLGAAGVTGVYRNVNNIVHKQ